MAGVVVLPDVVVLVAAGALKLNGLLVTVDLPSSFLSLSLPNENLGVVDAVVVVAAEEAASDAGLLKLNVGAVLVVVAVDVAGLMDPNVKDGVVVAEFALSSDGLAGVLNENVGVVVDAEVVAVDVLGGSVGLLKENPPKPVLAGAAGAEV